MSENETIVQVVPFSKAKEWHDWKELFLAKVNRKDPELGRYFNLSKPYPLTKMEGSEEVVDEEKLKIKRRAYDELLMSMSVPRVILLLYFYSFFQLIYSLDCKLLLLSFLLVQNSSPSPSHIVYKRNYSSLSI